MVRRWDHHWELVAAVAAEAPVSAQAVVSLQLGPGAPQAVALGDALGGVMLLRPSGELLIDFSSGVPACIRAAPMQPPHTEAMRRNLLRGVFRCHEQPLPQLAL